MITEFNFVENTFMVPYTKEVADYCDPFSCGDEDLDEFFSHDVFLYEEELLGKTYIRAVNFEVIWLRSDEMMRAS